jgi:hypothetical protein
VAGPLFTSMPQSWALQATWRKYYNTIRPHSKLSGRAPAEIAGQRGWGRAPDPVAIASTKSHQREDSPSDWIHSGEHVTTTTES